MWFDWFGKRHKKRAARIRASYRSGSGGRKRGIRKGSWYKHSVTGKRVWVPRGGDMVRYLD